MCRDEGFYADAVSRAYYAIMHGAKAALESRQISPRSHQGVRNQFGLHLVRTGLIEREWSATVADSLRERLSADYDPAVIFDKATADRMCEAAAAFLDRIRLLLPPEVSGGSTASRP